MSRRWSSWGFRWFIASVWTIAVAILLLKPVKNSPNHNISLKDFITSFFSLSFDTWDLVEAIYHIILFTVLTAVWYWALAAHLSRNRALVLSVGIAVLFGTVTEIGQHFVNRSSLMLDAVANFLGVALCVIWLKRSRQL